MRTNLHHLLEQSAARAAGAPALTYRDRTVTYAEAWQLAESFAAALLGVGLSRDDRVGIYLDKRIETVAAIFGTSRAGGVFVPVNHILKAQQVAYILGNCDVRVLVTTSDRLALLADQLAECPALEAVILIDEPKEPAAGGDGYAVTTWRAGTVEPGTLPASPRDRHRHGGDPLHQRQHREAEGRGAQPPQPDRRGRERQHLPGEHRRRRHPVGAAAELRRRVQPDHHGVRGRRPRDLDELPLRRRGAEAVRQAPGDRADLCAPALAADRRPQLAGGGDRAPAVLREHRWSDAARPRSIGCGRSSRRRCRT